MLRRAFGSSLQTTLDGEFTRWFTSLFLTAGGWRFFASALILALSVGTAEWTHGTRRTMGIFLGTHFVTLLVIYFALILPFASGQFSIAKLLVDARDVGPSAGYYGCLGLLAAGLSRGLRFWFATSLMIFLLARLIASAGEVQFYPHLVIGDAAHLIAFPVGVMLAKMTVPRFLAGGGSQLKHQPLK
jgi:hypothetical protein